ncbi:MAG: Type 4 pili biogenesis protein pilB (nuleotide-binding protein) [Pandoraea sp.]|nr:MAG: Type 4 pili biogenesis protein pilB (nuleotide-binding protein) [Pandoraea sp.]TAM15493.1 MAG: Type 4 pili biogenesis protein pilB (nuleotide-binding protein) [Pandoraea sp.]
MSDPRTLSRPALDDGTQTPAVRLLNDLLQRCAAQGASDIHFEPYEQVYRVRARIDGVLHEIATPPNALRDALSTRLKVLSRLDIAERRLPQDGRMTLTAAGRAIDCRVSTLPTLFGEKIVVRLLDTSAAQLEIGALGYEPSQLSLLNTAIQRPYGMILVTGPTGSGKTVSLYACLRQLNAPDRNIATVEDPAEIHLPGINQVNINEKAGLTFATALRAFLRQDPDVLMVGEIRDAETADIAVKAAQTGHLVLSTLHTNDAPGAVTRLLNMGVAPFNLASALLLVSAQRLVRKLCEHCRAPAELSANVLRAAGLPSIAEGSSSGYGYRPVGCDACLGSGYRGRTGIHQVMPTSEAIRQLMLSEAGTQQIAAQACREGAETLRQAGLKKVMRGETSLEEIIAATHA